MFVWKKEKELLTHLSINPSMKSTVFFRLANQDSSAINTANLYTPFTFCLKQSTMKPRKQIYYVARLVHEILMGMLLWIILETLPVRP